MHTLSFKVIGLLVMERRFSKVFTIYGHGGHVGHVTQLICINFHSYSPSSFHYHKLNCFIFKIKTCNGIFFDVPIFRIFMI